MKEIHGGDVYRNKIKTDFSVNINPFGIPGAVEDALYTAVESCIKYPDITAEKLKKAVKDMLDVPEEYLLFMDMNMQRMQWMENLFSIKQKQKMDFVLEKIYLIF